jgi:hypothetical protein
MPCKADLSLPQNLRLRKAFEDLTGFNPLRQTAFMINDAF